MPETKADMVKEFMTAVERGFIEKAGGYLADDFEFLGPTLRPIDKQGFLQLHRALVNAMPDWSYNMSDVEEHDDIVTLKVHITGTHMGELHIPSLGLIFVPATGLRATLPEERIEISLSGDKIASLKAEQIPNGGLSGILNQLGIELPDTAAV